MAEERLKQTHNRLDKMEDTANFYEYDPRWVGVTGPRGRNLMVLSPVYRSRNEKIVAGTIPPGFDGQVRLPKRTQRAIFSPTGSVSTFGIICINHIRFMYVTKPPGQPTSR
jgi:hypothetical protein